MPSITYYVVLDSGITQPIENVTATPTVEDREEYTGATYRNSGWGVSLSSGGLTPVELPGESVYIMPDEVRFVEPRFRQRKRTYTVFTVTDGFEFAIPTDHIISMGTAAPTL